uniref:Uncharacterized protein n=1 Tax=Anguilla anguilla TaxID=7936 RepID=A0A0E9QG27_ANGAN
MGYWGSHGVNLCTVSGKNIFFGKSCQNQLVNHLTVMITFLEGPHF